MRHPLLQRLTPLLATAMMLSGCITIGNADKPIATILVPATAPAAERTLVIVLPGFGSDAEDLRKHKIAAAVHQHWPQADVLLTSATFAYYKRRNIISRLDQDVVGPARSQGYKQIWLAGASVGGMGVLFYEYQHPGEMTGLVLLAPWLGSADTLDQIRKAGGIREWDPGPVPSVVDNDNYQRELWRVAKDWSQNSALASRVWLICGSDDRLLPTSRLLATALPASHYIELPGGAHNWSSFISATDKIIERLRQPAAESGR
ncbi:MAG: alpha/beta fold hydrolase [Stenotrophobium sp.]